MTRALVRSFLTLSAHHGHGQKGIGPRTRKLSARFVSGVFLVISMVTLPLAFVAASNRLLDSDGDDSEGLEKKTTCLLQPRSQFASPRYRFMDEFQPSPDSSLEKEEGGMFRPDLHPVQRACLWRRHPRCGGEHRFTNWSCNLPPRNPQSHHRFRIFLLPQQQTLAHPACTPLHQSASLVSLPLPSVSLRRHEQYMYSHWDQLESIYPCHEIQRRPSYKTPLL